MPIVSTSVLIRVSRAEFVPDVIHGDIKPKNVLVFEDGSENYTTRLADFGFSTHFRGDSDLISVPISVPWNAPEHHHRGVTPPEAKLMDVYSFGMLCTWLLFGSGALSTITLFPWVPRNGERSLSFEESLRGFDLLKDWKNEDGKVLPRWAVRLVDQHEGFDRSAKQIIFRFFELSLAYQAEKT
jgi:serine/threonine protein kinase